MFENFLCGRELIGELRELFYELPSENRFVVVIPNLCMDFLCGRKAEI